MSEQSTDSGEILQVIVGVLGIFAGVVVLMIIHAGISHSPLWIQVVLGAVGWAIFIWSIAVTRRRRDPSDEDQRE